MFKLVLKRQTFFLWWFNVWILCGFCFFLWVWVFNILRICVQEFCSPLPPFHPCLPLQWFLCSLWASQVFSIFHFVVYRSPELLSSAMPAPPAFLFDGFLVSCPHLLPKVGTSPNWEFPHFDLMHANWSQCRWCWLSSTCRYETLNCKITGSCVSFNWSNSGSYTQCLFFLFLDFLSFCVKLLRLLIYYAWILI